MKFGLTLALLGAISSVLAAPSQFLSRNSTNAERLARGLAPRKPARLYDPSRRGAILPRASGNTQPTFNVVSTSTQPRVTRKRRSKVNKREPYNYPQGYIGVNRRGNLIYSTSSADGKGFFWNSPADPQLLCWTATFTNADVGIQLGTNYPVFARSTGTPPPAIAEVWNLMVGSQQVGDNINWLSNARFPSDINVRPSTTDVILFALGDYDADDAGTVGVTNDFAAARDYADGIESALPMEIIIQTLPSTSPWSIEDALTFYFQGTKLVNPVSVHAQDYTGQITGWSTIFGGSLALQNAASGQTFYLPLLNSGSQGPMIYYKSGMTCTIGVQSSSGTQVPQPMEYDNAQETPYLPVSTRMGQYNVISFPTFNSLYGFGGSNPSLVAVSESQSLPYNLYPTAQPICMETLPVGGTPSNCASYYTFLRMNVYNTFGSDYHLFIYDYVQGDDTGYYNLAGPADSGAVGTISQTPYSTFNTLTVQGSPQPYLYSFYQQFATELFTAGGGTVPLFLPQNPTPNGYNGVQFTFSQNVISGTGGIILPNGGSAFFYLSSTPGDPVLRIASSPPSQNYRVVCVELVPVNGSPQYCAAG